MSDYRLAQEMMQLRQEVASLKETVRRLSVRSQNTVRIARQADQPKEDDVVQGIRISHNERELNDVTAMQFYGLAASTLKGSDHMVINMFGDNSNGVAVASNDQRHRPKNLPAGAVCLYNNGGITLTLSGNTATLTANTLEVHVPTAHFTGDVNVDGDVKAGTISLRHHKHSDPQGGSTGEPTA